MTWIVLVSLAWVALALPFGMLLGRAMRVVDRRHEAGRLQSVAPDFIPDEVLQSVALNRPPRG